ncbi:MAG TPA: lamin tail domain-containing protein, partial [Archangium sp.]
VALEVKDNAGNAVRTTRPVSTPFPTPSKLVFLDQPTNGTAGSTQVPLRVAIQDADGLLASNATSLVTLTVKGVAGFGPFYATADKGVATFSDVRIDKAGQGYTLEATSFSLTSATSNPFDIQHGAAASLTLSAEAPKVSYGTKTRATVTVLDAHGNVAEGYTGTVTLSSGDLAASLPEAHAFTATDKGQYTFEPIILRTEGVQTLKASATGLTDGTAEVEVLLGKLMLTGLPATMKAGDSATVAVEVLDGFGVRDTGYTGTVRFTFSDPKGGPLPEYTFTTADLGRKEFTVTVVTLGEQTLKVEDKALSWLSGTASTTVKWGAPVALVLEAPESAVAGNPFSARVTMRDGLGNAVEDYTGIVSFTADATGATVPADYSFTPEDKGSRLFSFTLEKAVSTQLTVTDMALALSGSDTVGVSHSTATRLVLAFVPAPTEPVVAGTGLLLEVTARDAFGNVATGYAGTVRFESTDGQADLPPDTSFAGAKGHKSFSVTLKTAKDQSVSARDVVDTLLSEDASVRIVPGPARKLAFRAQPSSPKVRVAMTSVTVAVTDLYDNTVSVEEPEITVGLVDGNPDAELGGSLTALPSGGLATFSTLTVDQQGVGFRLEAMGGMFDVASSETFAVEDNLAPESAPLSLVRQTSTQVELSWTAVADDGLLGPAAASYDLRYSTSPITEATFASANPVVVGWPQPLGGVESALIKELTASTTYYFALKVVDDAGNASAMSTLSATTNVDPCASVTCTPSAPTCAADGVSLVTPTSTCVVAEDDTTSCQETQKTTACPGPDGVCFEAACDTAPKPTFGTLSISEVMHSPSGSTTEYIELTNNTGNLLNLNGLVVSYTLGSGTLSGSFTVGSGDVPVVVDRKGTFVLAHNQELATNGGVSANYAYDSAMPLEGAGTIKLVNGSTVVEVFTYDSGFPQTMGRSMNLSSAVVGTKANAQRWYWCDSEQQLAGGDFGTPNAPNSTCGITLAPPVDYCAIQYPKTFPSGDGNYPATVVPGSSWAIYSQFYEPGLTDKNTGGNDFYPHVSAELGYGTDATNPAGWTWTSASPNAGYSSSFSNNDEVKATLSIPTAGTYKYGFRYRLLDPFTGTYSPYTYCDQSGAVTPPAGSYGTVTVVSPPPPVLTNHLVISELAPAGPTGANDEFVELHNPTNAEVSLSNWKLQYKAANGAAYSVTYTFSIGAKIPARGYYLLALSGTGYSGSTIADGSYSLAMGGAGGHVRLVQADGTTVVDTVGYGSANAPEGSAITGTLGTSGSYERKAVSTSTAATMAVGGSDAT